MARSVQDICLYRVHGLSHSFRHESELRDVLYSDKALEFERWFQLMYTKTIAPENQLLVKVKEEEEEYYQHRHHAHHQLTTAFFLTVLCLYVCVPVCAPASGRELFRQRLAVLAGGDMDPAQLAGIERTAAEHCSFCCCWCTRREKRRRRSGANDRRPETTASHSHHHHHHHHHRCCYRCRCCYCCYCCCCYCCCC